MLLITLILPYALYRTVQLMMYRIINNLGPGALLSKIDLKDAFHLIPVRHTDWILLGIHWKQKFYINSCLPFGLRSAPYLFNRFSDALHWILQHNYGVEHLLHYLDEFSPLVLLILILVIKASMTC